MKLNPSELKQIVDFTLEQYERGADDFWEGTRDHNVGQNIAALLRYIYGEPPFTILDFGCGTGRDLKTFADLGHIAVGLDGASRFAAMARIHSGCEVWQQDFLKVELPDNRFDGVFANAALFHVPSQELPRVLLELRATLKPGGLLFSSNPRGHNAEGWNQGRYGAYYDLDICRCYILSVEVSPIDTGNRQHLLSTRGRARNQIPPLQGGLSVRRRAGLRGSR
jgi:SAM-dependent methyltransferase